MIDIFIAGAQKAGTTTLKSLLGQHPNLKTHDQMEMTFFYLDEEYAQGVTQMEKFYGLSDESGKRILAKHATGARINKSAERIAKHNPQCKILFLTRDPVNRSFSSYYMAKKNGALSESFDEVLKYAFENRDHWFWNVFVKLGCYTEQLDILKAYFPKKNILVYKLEDIKSDQETVMQKICKALDLPEFESVYVKANTSEEAVIPRQLFIINRFPKVKKIILNLFGRDRITALAKTTGELFNRKGKKETLSQYSESPEVQLLNKYYNNWNKKLSEEWSINY